MNFGFIINSVTTDDASTLGRRDSAISSVRFHDRPTPVTANERKLEKSVQSARSPRRHHKGNHGGKSSPLYIAPLIDCRWSVLCKFYIDVCGLNRMGFIGNQMRLTSAGNLRQIVLAHSLFVHPECVLDLKEFLSRLWMRLKCQLEQPTQFICHHLRQFTAPLVSNRRFVFQIELYPLFIHFPRFFHVNACTRAQMYLCKCVCVISRSLRNVTEGSIRRSKCFSNVFQEWSLRI